MHRVDPRAVVFLFLLAAGFPHPGCGDDAQPLTAPELLVEPHTVLTEDGVEIALYRYFPSGVPVGPSPLLLCPGFSENHLAFDLAPANSMARYLAGRGIDTWAIDLRGRGSSGPPEGTDARRDPSATGTGWPRSRSRPWSWPAAGTGACRS